MSIYYIKQDNTDWCCEADSGSYYEKIETAFVRCECDEVWANKVKDMAQHLQGHSGNGRVLKWRQAKPDELAAWYSGKDDVFDEGIIFERKRIIQLIEEQVAWWIREEDWHHLDNKNLIALIKEEN